MSDQYAWWRAALEDSSRIGKILPVHEGDPQPGFYRKRKHKDGPFIPVAIWMDDSGHMLAQIDGQPGDAVDIWTWCCREPVSYDDYKGYMDGKGWPDEAPPTAGHNQPPESDDPHENLAREFEQEREQAEQFLKEPIKDRTRADMAASWSKKLATIAKKATDLHKVEKQPHLDAGRDVDDKWRDLKEEPKSLSTRIKRALDDFLREEDRKEQERQRKAAEEAARKQREADEAAQKAMSDGQDAEAAKRAEIAAQEAEHAKREAERKDGGSAGRTGAKVSLRTFVSAKITDYDKALIALKDHPEMKALVEQLANRAVRAGHSLEGVERVEEKRAA